ncbi:enolase C-terminal domain-like protein [Fodinibius halophilus]|uniref:Mandelate racemase/muconate lactonizing enzyme C-terminal domain-containing protein n=1 Tax=Fodinibius halophilus TaxID=1736908 RepID=A0A6M1T1F6_9BACT|nr:enolase C-terminal domain-like protein [Fodinibius halophilus]NGP87015.1 hypothetical protein [Fodinibius halophilus]
MKLTAYQYYLPFKKNLNTSNKSFKHRTGILLEYPCDDGRTVFGEAAPLPGFSKKSLDKIVGELKINVADISEALNSTEPVTSLQKVYETTSLANELAFGLDTLAYQITAQNKGTTMSQILFSQLQTSIKINALGDLLSDNIFAEVKQFVNKGFKTIKFKVGRNVKIEYQQLREIRSIYPDLTVRLDANQAWPLKEAITNCNRFSSLGIEYLEEPIAQPSPQNYEDLTQNIELPIGIDESIIHTDWWPNILPFTSYVILKPMLLGNFKKIFATNRLANTHDNKTVLTTSLESGIGRIMTAIFSSGFGNRQTAHGLMTGTLLARDLIDDSNCILNGEYQIPLSEIPFTIDPNILNQLSPIRLQK